MTHSRYFQAIASLAGLFAAYCGYSAVVVPIIEPSVRRTAVTVDETQEHESPTEKYRELIEPLFTAESWERGEGVHVIKTHGFYLLLRTISQEEGQLRLEPCTMVHLPTQFGERTWIIQASKGATLEFDRPFDWQTGEIGELKAGFLPGRVLISGSPSDPGANDRVEIDTQGVQFNKQTISTTEDVHFRYGQSFGSGCDLTIRLAAVAEGRVRRLPSAAPTEIRQIELIQLHQAVIFPPQGSGLQGLRGPTTPIHVSADGPVTIDIQGGSARVARGVRVERQQPDGDVDRVECDQLAAYFGRQPLPLPAAGSTATAIPRMQFERLVATGQPARVTTSTGGSASSQLPRWHRLESDRLEYLVGDSPGLGQFQANGQGSYVTGTAADVAEMTLHWSDRVEVLPHDGMVDLAVLGNADCRAVGLGAVQSQSLWVQLVAAAPAGLIRSEKVDWNRLRPRSILAEEKVHIHSDQLDAHTDRVDVVFHQRDGLQPLDQSDAGPLLGSPRNTRESAAASPRRFDVRAERLQIDVAAVGRQHQLEQVILEGHVRCQEVPRDAKETPIEMTGDQLKLTHMTRQGGLAVVIGRPAVVKSPKMTLAGGNINLDRDQNQLWIDGPGSAEAPLPERLAARSPRGPAVVDVNWEEGMRFDGKTLLCQGGVLIKSPAQRIQANELAAMLTEPVDFGGQVAGPQVGLHTIVATGDVSLENQTVGDQGWVSVDRAQVARLEVNYVVEEITGSGPGWVETVRRGKSLQAAAPAPPRPAAEKDGLNYLRVNFEKGFDGGLARRQLTFRGRVRSIMGPVHDWNQRLNMQSDGQLYPNTAVLGCRELTVYQLPVNATTNRFELVASGNTMVEGKTPNGQLFAAKGERLSYDQAKDVVILHGDGRNDAQLWHQSQVDGPRSTVSAQRIRYRPQQNSYELGGVNMLDFTVGP